MSKFCSNCGAELEDNQKFCTSCGVETFSREQAPAAENPQAFKAEDEPINSKKAFPWKIVIPIVAVLLVGAIVLGILFAAGVFKKEEAKQNAKYQAIIDAAKATIELDSFSFKIDTGFESDYDEEFYEISGKVEDAADENGVLWIEAADPNDSDDLEQHLIKDGTMYTYYSFYDWDYDEYYEDAYIDEIDLAESLSDIEKDYIPEAEDLENMTIEKLCDLFDISLREFKREFGRVDEEVKVNLLEIIEKHIKVSNKNSKTTYTCEINIRDILMEAVKAFRKAADDEDALEDLTDLIKDEIDKDAELFFEITVKKNYIEKIEFEVDMNNSYDENFYLDFEIYDVNDTNISNSKINDFIELCEDYSANDYDDDYYDDFYDDDYYYDDYYDWYY